MIIRDNFLHKTYVMTPHLNHLHKTVQMRGHNIWFWREIRKIIIRYAHLSRALLWFNHKFLCLHPFSVDPGGSG